MRRFLALALGLVLLAGCAPAQPVDADSPPIFLSPPPSPSPRRPPSRSLNRSPSWPT